MRNAEDIMSDELANRIVVDPRIRFGKPVIRGTRVPVDLLAGQLRGGMSAEEIADAYDVTVEDVHAAAAYVARRRTTRDDDTRPCE
jgi:uncharacterized protein (DUF433 family)